MNERIRELKQQAWVDDDPRYGGYTDLEKFAELIVRECAQVAEDVDGDSRARKCVLEHFGVEE